LVFFRPLLTDEPDRYIISEQSKCSVVICRVLQPR
jgi:hypothetical protein